jgi:hypothetical protein
MIDYSRANLGRKTLLIQTVLRNRNETARCMQIGDATYA